MRPCALQLLGGFALETTASSAPLRLGRKAKAMLAYVAMHGSAGASRSRLVNLLWAEQSEDDARGAFRQCLHLVRRELGDKSQGLDSDGDRILLREAVFDLDIRRFETLAAANDLPAMLDAAELYRGDFVDGLDAGGDFDAWAAAERERLRDIAHGLLARLSGIANEPGACEQAVRLARRLLASDPVHEGCYRALIRLHARGGLRAKALQTWNECRAVLRRELGIEPSAETAAMIDRLRADEYPGDAAGARGPAPAESSPGKARLTVASMREGDDPVIFDLMLRGSQLFSMFTADGNASARAAFESVIARANDHADAIAMLGWTHWFDSLSGWSDDPALSYQYASSCAARAIACNRGQPMPHMLQGKVLLWRMEHDRAIEELQHALRVDPESAYSYFNLGDGLMWGGHCDEALAHLERALQIDPNDHGVFMTIRGVALWMRGRLREARAALASAATRNPTYVWAHGALTAVHMELGDLESARSAAATARRLNRRFSLSFCENVLPFRIHEHRQRMLEAWRDAGMPQEEASGGQIVATPPLW
jgi:DNA-binding SARP family transcriptional activator